MLALQALCLFDALDDSFLEQLNDFLRSEETHADLGFETPPALETLAFARALATGAWRQHAQYDEWLTGAVAQWRVERMPPVDRNILRLGLHELTQNAPDAPPEVVLNEAVDLAHLFGDADTPAFVNGVLDAIRKQRLSSAAVAEQGDADGPV